MHVLYVPSGTPSIQKEKQQFTFWNVNPCTVLRILVLTIRSLALPRRDRVTRWRSVDLIGTPNGFTMYVRCQSVSYIWEAQLSSTIALSIPKR